MKKIVVSLLMLASMQVSASSFLDKFDYIGNKTFSCTQCTQADVKNHGKITHSGSVDVGIYKYKYIATSGVYDVSVTVSPDKLTNDPFDTYESTIASAKATLNNQYTFMKMSLDDTINQVSNALKAGYEVKDNFPYESVYQVLTEKEASKSAFNYFIKNDSKTSTKVQNARTAAEALAGSLSVSGGLLLAAQIKVIDGTYVTVTFSDGTMVELKITIAQVNGEITIKIAEIGDAYNADGTPVPMSPTQVQPSYSGVHPSFGDYLTNIGVNVSYDNIGNGGGSCNTKMTCSYKGQQEICTVSITDC